MITMDGKWIMEGFDHDDPRRIKNHTELTGLINDIGFLPLFKNEVEGFSVEELTASDSWWSGNQGEDPWEWREVIAAEGKVAYGKLFGNKAGFVSKEWYPYLAAYRRDGYDYESRYEDGLASSRTKKIMDILDEYDVLLSNELKQLAGFGKGKEKGFEGSMTQLQMQTYITVREFKRKTNKQKKAYGWPVAGYSLSENLFGKDFVLSQYDLGTAKAKQMIINHLQSRYNGASEHMIEKVIK